MKQVTVRVPGKLMFAGEYAVLSGGRALAATLSRTLDVHATLEGGTGAWVDSDLWTSPKRVGDDAASLEDPLCEAVDWGMKKYGLTGVQVEVRSSLNVKDGVGTSSALRLGVLLALSHLAGREDAAESATEGAWLLQRRHQPGASGYDVATQWLGGLVEFSGPLDDDPDGALPLTSRVSPLGESALKRLSDVVRVFRGGRGAPTGAVMKRTLAWLDGLPDGNSLHSLSERVVDAMISFAKGGAGLDQLIQAISRHRTFFEPGPDFPREVMEKARALPGFDDTFTLKTTGAGGEDALLAVGSAEALDQLGTELAKSGWTPLGMSFGTSGTRVEVP